MKPNERIFLDGFYQLHGRHLYGDEWNDNRYEYANEMRSALNLWAAHVEKITSEEKEGSKVLFVA